MKKVKGRFEALTPTQREALGYVAIGKDGEIAPQTLRSLAAKGLIEEQINRCHTMHGIVEIKRYVVPLPIHIEWCAWCAATIEDEP